MKRVITYGTFDLLHYGHINLLKRARDLGDYLIIPEAMLREDRFLDDVSVRDVERALQVRIKITPCGADGTIDTVLSAVKPSKK